MVELEIVEPGRPAYLATHVTLPPDGYGLHVEKQGGFLVLRDANSAQRAGLFRMVDGVGQFLAQYRAQLVLKAEGPRGVSTAYLVDGDELPIGRATVRVHCDRSVVCPACGAKLGARPLQGFGFPIDRCVGCLTISRNRPEQPAAILVEGAFVRRMIARIERAAEDGTLDDALSEIRRDPELRPVLQLPEIARLARRGG